MLPSADLGVLRRAGEAAAGRAGLDDHRTHRVGNDVVELARDACALGVHPIASHQFALALGSFETFLECVRGHSTTTEVVAENE